MTFRKTQKRKIGKTLRLERKTLYTHQNLSLIHEKCVGCNICIKVCPEKAISKLFPSIVKDGRLLRKATLDIDQEKCNFCGICMITCPTNAIEMERNGKKTNLLLESKAFPRLIREIAVNIELCDPSCNLICQENCPTKALEVIVDKNSGDSKIVAVKINKESCIYCTHCEETCPNKAIIVKKPFKGVTQVKTELCPRNCQVCVDICPAKTIEKTEGSIKINERYCIFCDACQENCPKNAIKINRIYVSSSKVKSGAWLKALEILTSSRYVHKYLDSENMEKKRELAETFS